MQLDTVYQGDADKLIEGVPDFSVDLMILDPNFDIWDAVNIKKFLSKVGDGFLVLFARQPMTSRIMQRIDAADNRFVFRDEIIWYDPQPQWVSSDKCLKVHENILVYRTSNARMNPFSGQLNGVTAKNKGMVKIGKWETGKKRVYKPNERKQITSVIQSSRDLKAEIGKWGKPPKLCRQIVETYSNPGDLVLDPFSGSGEFLMQSRSLGRSFLGFEIDESRHDAMLQRLSDEPVVGENKQQELFGVSA